MKRPDKTLLLPSRPPDTAVHLENVLECMKQLQQALTTVHPGNLALLPSSRRIKIQPVIREKIFDPHYTVPAIHLCGNWLEQAGFPCNQHARILSLHQLLIIYTEE